MEANPELSTREHEMLQYLEDLQRDNPAEYEQLVQQLQSQQAAKHGAKAGGTDGAPDGGQQVTPRPGFVAKTRSATKQGAKVFINICQHEAVDTPQTMEAGEDGNVPLRIPLSLGPPREDLDKEGELCTVYDVVFHPDTVADSLADTDFRQLMLELSLHQIKQKYSDELSHEITYPKLKGNYKGLAPLPQFMRSKASGAPNSSAAANANDGVELAKGKSPPLGKLVEEVASADEAELAAKLPAPAYAVEPRRYQLGGGAGGAGGSDATNGGMAECLSIKVHMPLVSSADELDLKLSAEELELYAPGKYRVVVLLPRAVALTPLSANFESRRRILSLALRVEEKAPLEEAAPTIRAKRRVACSKKTNASKARSVAELGDEHGGEEDRGGVNTAPSDGAAATVAPTGGEPAPTGGEPAPMEAKQACGSAAKPSEPVDDLALKLGNSIMFELEAD